MGPTELHWKWAEGRSPSQRIVVKVDKVVPWDGGFLGIGKSPSLPTGFSDPMELHGTVLAHQAGWDAKEITLVIPGEELADARQGDNLALAVLDEGSVFCICAAKVPPEQNAATLAGWLATWKCKTVSETILEQEPK